MGRPRVSQQWIASEVPKHITNKEHTFKEIKYKKICVIKMSTTFFSFIEITQLWDSDDGNK